MATLANLLPFDNPNDPAVILPGSPELNIPFVKLSQHIHVMQKKLAAIGVGPGTVVSICLPNSLEFVTTFLAISWQRGISAPLNPDYKQDEIEFYVDDLGAAVIVVPKENYDRGAPAVNVARKHNATIVECYVSGGVVVFDVKEIGKSGSQGDRQIEEPREHDDALVLYTSGTTGRPKAVNRRRIQTKAEELTSRRYL